MQVALRWALFPARAPAPEGSRLLWSRLMERNLAQLCLPVAQVSHLRAI